MLDYESEWVYYRIRVGQMEPEMVPLKVVVHDEPLRRKRDLMLPNVYVEHLAQGTGGDAG